MALATVDDVSTALTTTELPVYDPPAFAPVIYIFIILLGLAGNTLTIAICIKKKSMRNPGNVFMVNLAVADNGVMLCIIPHVHTTLANHGVQFYSSSACFWHAFLIITCCSTSLVSMGCIAVTRYISIVHPNRKQTLLQWRWCILAAILVWVYAILLMVPGMAGWGRLGWLPKQFHCSYDWGNNIIYNNIIFLAVYGFTTIAICVCYFKIYRVFKASRNRVAGNKPDKATSGGKSSNEFRLAFQLIVIYVIYNVCWFPFFIVALFVDPLGKFPVALYVILNAMSYLNSSVNVIVYLIFNTAFRQECVKVVCFFRKPRQKLEDTSAATESSGTD